MIDPALDPRYVLVAVCRNIRALRNKSPDEFVCVLICSSLPAAVGMCKIMRRQVLFPRQDCSIPALSRNSLPLSVVIVRKRYFPSRSIPSSAAATYVCSLPGSLRIGSSRLALSLMTSRHSFVEPTTRSISQCPVCRRLSTSFGCSVMLLPPL